MNWKRITDSTSEPVDIDQMMTHLKITDENETLDGLAMLESYIVTARKWCEDRRGEAFTTQVFDCAFNDWPDESEIVLPISPLLAVTSVKYYDDDDIETVFAATNYHVDTFSTPGKIVLKLDAAWPGDELRTSNPIIIRFSAGYGDVDDVPDGFKQAIRMLTAHLWENPGQSIEDIIVRKNLFGIDQLLDMNRINII